MASDSEFDSSPDQSRRGCAVGSVLLAIACGVAGYYWYHQRQSQALTAMTASSGRLTLERDEGDSLTVIDPRRQQEIWYRVMLEDPPFGRRLSFTCEWIAPGGKVAHRNRYETSKITRKPWQTHARYQFPADAPRGPWRVRLLLQHREIYGLDFEVREE